MFVTTGMPTNPYVINIVEDAKALGASCCRRRPSPNSTPYTWGCGSRTRMPCQLQPAAPSARHKPLAASSPHHICPCPHHPTRPPPAQAWATSSCWCGTRPSAASCRGPTARPSRAPGTRGAARSRQTPSTTCWPSGGEDARARLMRAPSRHAGRPRSVPKPSRLL